MNFNKAEFFKSYGEFKQLPQSDRIEIAFAGGCKVGKISNINKSVNRKSLVRVASVPGKTATINFYSLENIYIVDLPGYGYAKVAKSEKQRWAGLIDGYFNAERKLELTFLLIDMRHPPSKDDLMMLDFLIETEQPFVIVLTKSDKLSKKQQAERMEGFMKEIPYADEITFIPFFFLFCDGVADVRGLIEEISSDGY